MAMAMAMAFHNSCFVLKKLFHLFTITLLSLSLPLSYLLFCRLPFILISFDRLLLLLLISFISCAAFLHNLLGKSILPTKYLPNWLLLCALHIAMALGIHHGIHTSTLGLPAASLWCRLMFFLGLHTTMIHWSKVAVKPLVDDIIFGAPVEESWCQRIGMAVSFGGLWCWKLRDEAQYPPMMDLFMLDLCSLGLYYLIVALGFVNILRTFVWFFKFLLRDRKEQISSFSSQSKRIQIV